MGLFDLFKSNKTAQLPKGAHELSVSKVSQLTKEAVQISFEIPETLQKNFDFV
jgi:hypothetical protein